MSFLPIVQRELIVRARRPGTHWTRWTVAAMAGFITLQILASNSGLGPAQSGGPTAFAFLLWLAAPLVVAAGLLTADTLSSERREGTLGLLFLTDLRGHDVVLGKLAAHGLNALFALVALAPVLTLPLLAGGVTGGEVTRTTLGLLALLLFSLAVGLWASAGTERQGKALATAAGIMLGFSTVPVVVAAIAALVEAQVLLFGLIGGVLVAFVILASGERTAGGRAGRLQPWIPVALLLLVVFSLRDLFQGPVPRSLSCLSPLQPLIEANSSRYAAAPAAFWLSLPLVLLEAIVFLFLASRRLQGNWREAAGESVPATRAELGAEVPPVLTKPRAPRRVTGDPIGWLVMQQPGQRRLLWLAAAIAGFYPVASMFLNRFLSVSSFIGVIYGTFLSTSLGSAALFAWLAGRFFQHARHSGDLEVLLSTPLGASEIVRGQWRALRRALIGPLVLCLLPTVLQWGGIWFSYSRNSVAGPWMAFSFFITPIFHLANEALRILALTWVGMWFGLRAPRPISAVAWTLALVFLGPGLCQWGWHLLTSLLLGQMSWSTTSGPSLPVLLSTLLSSLFGPVVNILLIRWAMRKLHGDLRGVALEPLALPLAQIGSRLAGAIRRLRHWTPAVGNGS